MELFQTYYHHETLQSRLCSFHPTRSVSRPHICHTSARLYDLQHESDATTAAFWPMQIAQMEPHWGETVSGFKTITGIQCPCSQKEKEKEWRFPPEPLSVINLWAQLNFSLRGSSFVGKAWSSFWLAINPNMTLCVIISQPAITLMRSDRVTNINHWLLSPLRIP